MIDVPVRMLSSSRPMRACVATIALLCAGLVVGYSTAGAHLRRRPHPYQISYVEIAPSVEMPLINFGGIVGDDAVVFEGASMATEAWKYVGLDTALNYGAANGRELAQLLSDLPRDGIERSQVFLTHKIECHCVPQMLPHQCMFFTSGSIRDAAQQLAGVIDLLLMHAPCFDPSTGAIDMNSTRLIWRAMEAAVATSEPVRDKADEIMRNFFRVANVTGKIRSIGLSNFGADQIDALLAMEGLRVRPALVQNGYSAGGGHPRDSSWGGRDERTFRKCKEERITFSAFSPLGAFTHVDVVGDPKVQAVADAHGVTAAEVALRWLVQQGIVVVTSSDTAEHVAADLRVVELKLTDEEMASL